MNRRTCRQVRHGNWQSQNAARADHEVVDFEALIALTEAAWEP